MNKPSPVARMILLGQWVIRRVADAAPCPCGGVGLVEHFGDCPVLDAFRNDEWSARQAEAAEAAERSVQRG